MKLFLKAYLNLILITSHSIFDLMKHPSHSGLTWLDPLGSNFQDTLRTFIHSLLQYSIVSPSSLSWPMGSQTFCDKRDPLQTFLVMICLLSFPTAKWNPSLRVKNAIAISFIFNPLSRSLVSWRFTSNKLFVNGVLMNGSMRKNELPINPETRFILLNGSL